MEIRNLSTFIKVVEEQSLSKAAKQLGYAQSTVTMQMQQLEQELGVSLYERVGKQIRITQEGQELLTYAVQIVKTSQEALQIGKGNKPEIQGSLRLGMSDTLGDQQQADWVSRYMTLYPKVQMQIQTAKSQALVEKLLHNEIDLIMTLDAPITDAALIHGHKKKEYAHFVTTPSHPLSSYSPAGEKETAEKQKEFFRRILTYPLLRGELSAAHERRLEMGLLEAGILLEHRTEIHDKHLLLSLLLCQNGVAFLPDQVARPYLKAGTLVSLDCWVFDVDLWQQMLYHKRKWLTEPMTAWINMLEEES